VAKRVERITYDPNDPMIAWVGGYCEGEASFYVDGGRPRIVVESTDPDTLERLQSIARTGTTKLRNRRPKMLPHHKDVYRFQCCGRHALDLMEAIFPYLGKRRQARVRGILDAFHTPATLAA
jgi:hypothetical protein